MKPTTLLLLAQVMSTGLCAGLGAERAAPQPRDPQRPETGRDRAARRRLAQTIAAETGLGVEAVYKALGAGDTEMQIRRQVKEEVAGG
jgi:hypothetical protein